MKMNVRTLLNESLPFLLALMTFMTILVSSRTLAEMQRQREDANRPELYAKDIGWFRIEMDSTGWVTASEMDSIPWMDASHHSALCVDLFQRVRAQSDEFILEFVNVGRGPAIDIRVELEWSNSAIEDHWITFVGDSSFHQVGLEEGADGIWWNVCEGEYLSTWPQESGYLLPADLNPEAFEVDLESYVAFAPLSVLHQTLMVNGYDEDRLKAYSLQSTHRLNVGYRSIDQAVFHQEFDLKLVTSFEWQSMIKAGSDSPMKYKRPMFTVDISIEPVGKEEIAG